MFKFIHPLNLPTTFPKSHQIWGILPILLLGFAILIHHLDHTTLWADEGWTIAASAEANPYEVIDQWVVEDVHPPLYFMILNIWRKFTGDTIFEMRFMAVLISLLGIAIMYRLGKTLFNHQAGLIAALFFALHDLVLVLTQEVRHYSLQLTLSALAIWLYWRFWQKPNRARVLVFVIGGAALIYTHYWGGFILLSLGIHGVLTQRQKIRALIYGYLGIGLLYLPWLPSLYHQITRERPEGLPHALENSWVVYKTLVFQLVGVPEAFWLILAGIGILGVFTVNWSEVWNPKKHDWLPTPATLLPILIILLTVGLSLGLNTRYPSLSFRSLAVIIPAITILVAHTLAQFQWREKGIILAFILVHALTTTSARPVERAPWKEMAKFLSEHTTTQELILLEMGTDDYALVYYLSEFNPRIDYAYTETQRKKLDNAAAFQAYLDKTLDGYDSVWIAKFDWAFYDLRADLIKRGFVETSPPIFWSFYVDGRPIELWRLDRLPTQPQAAFQIPASQDALALSTSVLHLERASASIQHHRLVVNSLWTPIITPQYPYTVSIFLLDENGIPLFNAQGGLRVQDDWYPTFRGVMYDLENRLLGRPNRDYSPRHYVFERQYSTLHWEVGKSYLDSRQLDINGLPSGRYQVALKVYYVDQTLVDLTAVEYSTQIPVGTYIPIITIDIP